MTPRSKQIQIRGLSFTVEMERFDFSLWTRHFSLEFHLNLEYFHDHRNQTRIPSIPMIYYFITAFRFRATDMQLNLWYLNENAPRPIRTYSPHKRCGREKTEIRTNEKPRHTAQYVQGYYVWIVKNLMEEHCHFPLTCRISPDRLTWKSWSKFAANKYILPWCYMGLINAMCVGAYLFLV